MGRETGRATMIAALTAPFLAGCEPVYPTPVIPTGYEIEFAGLQNYELGQDISIWSSDLGFNAWDSEQLYVGLYDNGINRVASYKIKYAGAVYTYNFYYSSENLYNHIVPTPEEFAEIYKFIFDVYSQYYKDGEFGIVRSANIFLGRDWKAIDRSMTYFSPSGIAYSFVEETNGLSPVDKEFMEFIHTLLMDVNNTSFHAGRESFAGSLGILINSCRLRLPYDSNDINAKTYINRVRWAKAMNLSVPDANDLSQMKPVEIITFTEDIYNRAMSIWSKHIYKRPETPNQDIESQRIKEINRAVRAMVVRMEYSGLKVRKRDLRLWEESLLQEYLKRFPNASVQYLIEAAYAWLRYGAV